MSKVCSVNTLINSLKSYLIFDPPGFASEEETDRHINEERYPLFALAFVARWYAVIEANEELIGCSCKPSAGYKFMGREVIVFRQPGESRCRIVVAHSKSGLFHRNKVSFSQIPNLGGT
jgi:hypothetical protein